MLILLSGPDSYRREAEKRRYLLGFAQKYPAASRGRFDVAEEGEDAFLEFVANQSLFASRKLAVLENVSADIPKRTLAVVREAPAREDIVLLVSTHAALSAPLSALAKKHTGADKKNFIAEEFAHLEGREWIAFIKTQAKKEGAQLADDALEFLRSRYEKDEWGLATELQKIGTMGEGIRSRKEIEPLDAAETPNFFGLLGGLKSQRLAERLTALERIFASREPAVKFFNVLAYGGPEYLRRFAEYDVMIKSGKLEYDEALLDSVL